MIAVGFSFDNQVDLDLAVWDNLPLRAILTGLASLLAGIASLWATGHAAIYKRDSRALIGWIGIIWLAPFAGTILYATFGINRIQRKARALRDARSTYSGGRTVRLVTDPQATDGACGHLHELQNLVARASGEPLLPGNRVNILRNGDEAYPAMLQAIDGAERSVTLCTYIIDRDHAGQQFLEALQRAQSRGVQVRVLVDDVGARYSWPSMVRQLRRAQLNTARFLPAFVPWLFHYSNLRNHRKLLVVDGKVGFAGGLNIREEHCLSRGTRHPIQDMHFQILGPVVAQLQETFATDWYFTTDEVLEGEVWFPPLEPAGSALARCIADGPEEEFDRLRITLLGAVSCAKSSIRIVTPYFLPDSTLITSLSVAALRGLDVRIVVPERTNLALVQWASTAQLWQLLVRGCRIWRSPAPFDHSKLMVVDDTWTLIGSPNWDERSLRLNFELAVEWYDQEFARAVRELIDEKIARSREVTYADVEGRSLAAKLRDGLARVLSPYL